MVVDLLTILTKYQSVVGEIRANLSSTGTNATGKTSQSLRFITSTEGSKTIIKIVGRPYFATVETGRKPTPQFTKPSAEFVASIKEWVKARGLPEGSAYAIAKHIHQKGTKLYTQGGREDIYSNVINQNLVDRISQDILVQFSDAFIKNVNVVWSQ